MDELNIAVLQGHWGGQVEYAFRYPQTPAGRSPFDRFWLGQAQMLQSRCRREPGHFPTSFASEWQETRRDGRFVSGFLDISRRVGPDSWDLWRISATFTRSSSRPLRLESLLKSDWKTALQSHVLKALNEISEGETPFFRGWQRRVQGQLGQQRFYLTGEGLCLWFPQETLAPRAAGLPTVLLPYDRLDILRPLC